MHTVYWLHLRNPNRFELSRAAGIKGAAARWKTK